MSGTGIGVFVLGMHRSGTSAATRAINLLGVPVATDDELKAPSPRNPTGFWEVPRLTGFNNELLAELGGSSLGPPVLEPGWASRPELERRRTRARRLHAKAHRTDQWVWKDPRNCVLFPFWREAIDATPVVVLVHREPVAVARSLEARQGLSIAMGFAVWERYLREALSGAAGLPVFVAPYGGLTRDPEGWSRAVGGFLRERGVACDPEAGAMHVAELVASSGSEERGGMESATPLVPSEPQRRLITALESLSGAHPSLEPPELGPETEWVEPLLAERRAADVQRRQMDERLRVMRRRMRAARAAHVEADQRLEQAVRSRRSPLRALTGRLPGRRSANGGTDTLGGLPHFLIIGAQKCGTSSLFRYLGLSPDVALPEVKEIHFFDLHFERGVDWYRSQLPATSNRRGRRPQITGEASPYYMFHPLTAARIRETLPDVRLIALLRDPTERAVSHYYHELGNGHETLPLAAALDQEEERLAGESERIVAEPGYVSFNHRHFSYQSRGVYVDQLRGWREVFEEDQLLVVNSHSLFRDPRAEMRRVYAFLGLRGEPPSHYSNYNVRDYPSVPDEIDDRLRERFATDNDRLYEWLGEDLGVGHERGVGNLTRIAYVYAGNAPVFGRRGASVHMQEVIRALMRRGGRVDIVARRLGGSRLPGLEAIPVHKLSGAGGGGRGGRRAWDDTNREVRERLTDVGPVDLVYERFSLGSVAAMEHARATGAVGVLEMNGPRIEKAAARGVLEEPEEAEQAAARAVEAAVAVVAVSEPVAEYARARFPGANVTTIPNGVDPGRFPPELLDEREAAARPFTVGFVGTFKAHHGLDTLVDAFASLRRAERDARLLLVGEGPALSSVRGRLEELGLSGAARFTGAVPPDQVPSLLSEMDVGVAPYPTRRSYVSPLKVFEYLAAGLPVVASGAEQITELVGDGEAGLLVEPENPTALAGALQELASEPERRARLGRAGRAKVLAGHTWDAVAVRILALAEPDTRTSHG